MRILNQRSIPISYLSENGRTIGTLLPEPNPNALLRSRQYKASFDPDHTLAIARQFVQGKLVEFSDMNGRAYAIETFNANQLMVLHHYKLTEEMLVQA